MTTRRVLIVEDSPSMRQLLHRAVARYAGVRVDEAGDGVAALKALKEAQADPYLLILLDINMPVMDGMKLLGRLRDDPAFAGVTVAVITTDESQVTEQRARDLGARAFLRKPIDRRAVEALLAEVLGR
jgi:two-component system, chemotaxis family, chemotaxis protein CheY